MARGRGQGQLLHRDIGQVAAVHQEMAIAVTLHYAIGLTLALIYLFVSASLGLTLRKSRQLASLCARTSFRRRSCSLRWAMHGLGRTVQQQLDCS